MNKIYLYKAYLFFNLTTKNIVKNQDIKKYYCLVKKCHKTYTLITFTLFTHKTSLQLWSEPVYASVLSLTCLSPVRRVNILCAQYPFPLWGDLRPIFTPRDSVVSENEVETQTWQIRAPYTPITTAIRSEAVSDSSPSQQAMTLFRPSRCLKSRLMMQVSSS